MKQLSRLLLFSIVLVTSHSCEDTATEEFNNTNGQVEVKLISSIEFNSPYDDEDRDLQFQYSENGELERIIDFSTSQNEETSFIYDTNGNLTSISDMTNNPFLIADLISDSPYDAFETGTVETFDENGNPSVIEFIEEEYDVNSGQNVEQIYTATLSYDLNHNPYFYTLEAAGLIYVLDQVELSFTMNPQPSQLVQARVLFPNNNPSAIEYRNQDNELLYTIEVDYNYLESGYPQSGIITATDYQNGDSGNYSIVYTYN